MSKAVIAPFWHEAVTALRCGKSRANKSALQLEVDFDVDNVRTKVAP